MVMGKAGVKLGFGDEERALFEAQPLQRWSDQVIEAMHDCYAPEVERDPKLVGFVWASVSVPAKGKPTLQLGHVPRALTTVMACVRKNIPPLPAIDPAQAGGGPLVLRLRFEGPGRQNPMLR